MVLTRMALAACLVFFTVHFYAFVHGDLSGQRDVKSNEYEAIVVFTGAYDRIDHALDLLKAGVAPRLFISGANPNAGIWLDRFTAQFGRGDAALARLIACCVTFGAAAETTLQNGAEAACWLQRSRLKGPFVLVTSWDHMPRAYIALSDFVDASRITRVAVGAPGDGVADWRWLVQEYMKLWATRLTTLAPHMLVARAYGPFREGCPHAAT